MRKHQPLAAPLRHASSGGPERRRAGELGIGGSEPKKLRGWLFGCFL